MKKTPLRVSIGLFACAVLLASAAHADISKKVQKTFAGDLLFTESALPEAAESPAATIALYKKAALKVLKHQQESDEVAAWSFYYTAFMKRAPGVSEMSIDFYTADGKYVANKRLMGINPKMTVLTGFLSITEDDGLTRGKDYSIRLVGTVRGKEVVFARGTLKMT
jgi:hypothetical protein